jgi:hypothetical protein
MRERGLCHRFSSVQRMKKILYQLTLAERYYSSVQLSVHISVLVHAMQALLLDTKSFLYSRWCDKY